MENTKNNIINDKISYDEFITLLRKEVEEDSTLQCSDISQSIYLVDNILVSGDIRMGIRANDHNCLIIHDSIDIVDVMKWGVIIIPENQTYISEHEIEDLRYIGYNNIPLNNNHIVGYRD